MEKALTVKRKRVSKKNKLAWRKHSRTEDVEEFLNEQLHEERFGINLSIAKDDKLFFVDTTLSDPYEKKILTKAEKKLAAKKKLEGIPKCFEALQPHTSVPDPLKKRNYVRSKEERKDPIRKKIEACRRAGGILTLKEKVANRNRKLYEIAKQSKPVEKEFCKDLWEEKVEEESPINSQWLNETTVRHVLQNTGKIRKTVPITVKTIPSVLPAIEAPHPGLSYNPSYADHQALLQQIVENEKKLIKEEKHINRVTNNMFSRVTQEQATETMIKELLEGHPKSLEYIVKEEEENEKSEYKPVNPPTKDKKKTRKTRRNIRLAREEEHQRKLKAIEKKKVSDIYKLKKIVQNMEKTELQELTNQALKEKKKQLKERETKKLSKVKFEDLETEFNMPYDLNGNLREIKIEGNILIDRFKSLQKRNILEPTTIQRHKIVKKKSFTLSSHKESDEIPVRRKSKVKK